jgi:hypothetical protein
MTVWMVQLRLPGPDLRVEWSEKGLNLVTSHGQPKETRGVSLCGLVIYTKKYLKAKEELWKLKYFTMQKYNLQKKSLKRNQNPSTCYKLYD